MTRFCLGAAITAAAAFLANAFGPSLGGLFLAFPAILPASLTLVARQQERRKAHRGLSGTIRGRKAAAVDAFGAFIGTAGLAGFAITIWLASTTLGPALALLGAVTVWTAVATGLWLIREGVS